MTLDRCLPQVLLRENRWRGTSHWIIITFVVLCTSILLITSGKIAPLAAVYTLSFLSIMALFAVGNMLLKRTRGRLPRTVRASWPTVGLALAAVLVGLVANVLLNPSAVGVFAVYVAITGAAVGAMLLRLELLSLGLVVSRAVVDRTLAMHAWIRERILRKVSDINSIAVVHFSKGDDLAILNRAALYVQQNEQTNRMHVVHVYERAEDIPSGLASQLATIDRLYADDDRSRSHSPSPFGNGFIVARAVRQATNLVFVKRALHSDSTPVIVYGTTACDRTHSGRTRTARGGR